MTISVVQERFLQLGAANVASVSLAFNNPVIPGSSIHVIWYGNQTGIGSATCSDSVNGAYPAAIGALLNTGTNYGTHFKFDNTASGTPNVTVTPNISATFMALGIREIGGTSGYDVQASAELTAPGTGTDAVTSGTATPSFQPGMISSLVQNIDANFATTVGTGFTLDTQGFWGLSLSCITQHLRYTSLSARAATATTAGGSNHFFIYGAFFKEAPSGPGPLPRQLYIMG